MICFARPVGQCLGSGVARVVVGLFLHLQYNEGHVPDIVHPGASAWGTDWIGETKVPSPLGAAPAKDQCEHVGHLVAFGNTEEWLHRQILGCRARNQPAQPPAGGRLPPFDHKTGEGHVPFHGATTTTRGTKSATK